MKSCLHIILAVLTAVLISAPTCLLAQEHTADEYVVKSAFLYNFAKFVEWPSESFPLNRPSFVICLIGNAPFGNSLDTISGKRVGEREVRVQRIDTLAAISSCNLLFVSESETGRLKPILDSARQAHVLTVSDMENFDGSGGIIRLFTAADKIRFSINDNAAHQAGLEISSQLLKLSSTFPR